MTLFTDNDEFEIPSRSAQIDESMESGQGEEWSLEVEYNEEYGDWDIWFRPSENDGLCLVHSYETKDDALEDMNRFLKAYLNGDESFRFEVL